MHRRKVLTRILAIVGTVLVLLPVIAPFLLAGLHVASRGEFFLDYLMPAELFPVALVGGLLLLGAAMLARAYRAAVGLSLLVAVGSLVASQAVAVASGLASGETAPEGFWWATVLGLLGLYVLALVALALGGALLLRALFGERPEER